MSRAELGGCSNPACADDEDDLGEDEVSQPERPEQGTAVFLDRFSVKGLPSRDAETEPPRNGNIHVERQVGKQKVRNGEGAIASTQGACAPRVRRRKRALASLAFPSASDRLREAASSAF